MIKKIRTVSGKVYEVSSEGQYAEIRDNDGVFVVETRYGTIIRVFSNAVESMEMDQMK
jgi:hypothetical protein